MPSRKEIIEAARELIGTPFAHLGRSAAELDCAGLVIKSAEKCGLCIEDKSGYAPNPDGKTMVEHLNKVLIPIPIAEARPADVVVMYYDRWPTHLALLSNDNPASVIHALRDVGKVCEHRIDERWGGRIVRAYQIPGVE